MKPKDSPRFDLASNEKLLGQERELQTLINILEPDPKYQPYFLADEASVFEITAEPEEEIVRRLKCYFGNQFNIPLQLPLWQLIDKIKDQFPEWLTD